MNRSVFRNALSKGNRDTCLRSLESALTGGKPLVQYLNDLLFTTTCVEWEQMSWAHPVIVMNSLKNMIGENRNSPSKTLLNFGLELLNDQPLRKDDAFVLNEATKSGVGLAVFVGDLEDALQDGKWNEAKLLAAKTFLASDRSRAIIDTLAAIALQNTDRNGTFVFHLLRSFHFQELKEDIWTYACSLLSIIEQQRLPEPHKRKMIEPENYLFPSLRRNSRNGHIAVKTVFNIAKKYLQQVSDDEKLSPHSLRHTFATHMLNNGADLMAIKDLLGHSSLSSTQVYTHLQPEKLKKIHEKAHPHGK